MFPQLALLLLIVVMTRKWLSNLKYRQFPGPSPFLSLPLIGHAYMLGKDPVQKMTELQRKYGDTFRFDVGGEPTIVLCKHEQVKAAFAKDVFSGRPYTDNPTLQAIYHKDDQGKAIMAVAFSEGPIWSEQRKFMRKSLSDLGMGNKHTMQEIIEEEVEQMAESLMRKKGQIIKSRGMFLSAANNVIWRISTGRGTKQDDPELIDLTNRIVNNFRNMDPSNPVSLLQMNSIQFTRLRKFLRLPNFLDSTKKVMEMIEGGVEGSVADEEGNYIEKALSEREKDLAEGKKTYWAGSHAKEYIASQLFDLFAGGTDTTATAIEWSLMYLMKFPALQERMFEEVKNITGGGNRRIGLDDRSAAHFTNAFFDELARHCQMGFLPPSHKTLSDVEFEGKLMPKGTQVSYFHYGINHDESHFPAPGVFNPDRFLDGDGRYCRDDRVMFFGVGKRRCPGELLARAELFLFVTRMVQQFRLKAEKPEKLSYKAIPGLVFAPQMFEFTVEERS